MKVFIGMPVFNGETYLELALNSLRAQTFTDWTLLISDNCSSDRTGAIAQHFCKIDSRIQYVRQSKNIGAGGNFKFLLEQANLEFFMWAASDDVWEPDFIHQCMSLHSSQNTPLAFTNLVSIDSIGREIRPCPPFTKIEQNDLASTVTAYLLDPEGLGKANLIYGIFKIRPVRDFLLSFLSSPYISYPGADMAIVLGVISRGGVALTDEVLFRKRLVRANDNGQKAVPFNFPEYPRLETFNQQDFKLYSDALIAATSETQFSSLVKVLLHYRAGVVEEHERASKNSAFSFLNVAKKFKAKLSPRI